jgi:hypothetical protein
MENPYDLTHRAHVLDTSLTSTPTSGSPQPAPDGQHLSHPLSPLSPSSSLDACVSSPQTSTTSQSEQVPSKRCLLCFYIEGKVVQGGTAHASQCKYYDRQAYSDEVINELLKKSGKSLAGLRCARVRQDKINQGGRGNTRVKRQKVGDDEQNSTMQEDCD